MLADVTLEAGGDHRFDLDHLRRQGAVRLVRLLLHMAGFQKPETWRIRVEKKFGCRAGTRPVSVVGARKWCCYVKIKPGDNNTGHYCSLLMPGGYQGETVFEALRGAEERVNLAWRRGEEDGVMMSEEAQPAQQTEPNGLFTSPPVESDGAEQPAATEPAPAETAPPADDTPVPEESAQAERTDDGEESEASQLLGWIQDEDQLHLTLLVIHELTAKGWNSNYDEFVASLAERLGWQNARRKQIGGVFTGLVRRGYIYRVMRGSQPIAYALTEKGRRNIEELLASEQKAPAPAAPAHRAAPAPAAIPLPDALRLGASLTEITQGYTAAVQKLQENRARRDQLQAEIAQLDAEAAELARVVANPEIQTLLTRLVQVVAGQGRG